jgi:hypothetical protein
MDWRVGDEIIQIGQSLCSPGNFPNRSAGRNLPSSSSVRGKRNTAICPACFMQRPLVNQKGCTRQAHRRYRALPRIRKPNLVFLAARLSSINIERNQATPLEGNTAVFVHIVEFFVKCHGIYSIISSIKTLTLMILHQGRRNLNTYWSEVANGLRSRTPSLRTAAPDCGASPSTASGRVFLLSG